VADLLDSYVQRDRVIVPTFEAYRRGGRVLASLATNEGVDVSNLTIPIE